MLGVKGKEQCDKITKHVENFEDCSCSTDCLSIDPEGSVVKYIEQSLNKNHIDQMSFSIIESFFLNKYIV
jgi:hypothetical protein